ncbi:MAG TPA: NAD(P)H-dependent oxidoreductase [Polyangiaceae bacterium]|jgi:NAD(P)H-dependent FMN reductase|nr:NAD(P)H-dependent oxidoreductase [Polyangiaceae bacterium]
MPKLSIIHASTREGRLGFAVAQWFKGFAERMRLFDVDLIDLRTQNLPLFDEPKHPRLRQYKAEHTRRWSALIDSADAFVFVTPEYNHSSPPALVNALDYLFHEWAYKPAGFVSYGGVSGGTRSVQNTKLTLCALRIVPIPEAVVIPFFEKSLSPDGTYAPSLEIETAGQAMLAELLRWTNALLTLREPE